MNADTLKSWRNAPRLTTFAEFFERTASGKGGAPDKGKPEPELALFGHDLRCLAFWDTHRRLWGHFDHHYFASIPFRIEEECRLGASILSFGLQVWARNERPATVYTLGAGAGTLSRTLARLADGRLKTLCCSPTPANRTCFFERHTSEHAHFHLGPFFDLDEERYLRDENLQPFRDGWDVLLEDTTFQMYGRDREDQLAFIAPRVRPDGLLIQVQKLARDLDEYLERERQKEEGFKVRYFSDVEIADKRRDVLDTMFECQVDWASTVSALKGLFSYSVVTWNSGNFYTIVSSNSKTALCSFVGSMVPPAIPAEYCYEPMPRLTFEDPLFHARATWRPAQPAFEIA